VPSPPSLVAEVLRDLGRLLEHLELRWYLFGAQAAILYGSTRVTADVDVTVELGSRTPQELATALRRARFAARLPLSRSFLAASRVIPVVHTPTRMPVDVVLAGPGIEELILGRTRRLRVARTEVPVARPEDLIALKVLAGRPHDLADVEALLLGQRGKLDIEVVRETLGALEAALDVSDLVPAFEARLAAMALPARGARAKRRKPRQRK
jgi:hypothetical protein